jgi:hypothetical protein
MVGEAPQWQGSRPEACCGHAGAEANEASGDALGHQPVTEFQGAVLRACRKITQSIGAATRRGSLRCFVGRVPRAHSPSRASISARLAARIDLLILRQALRAHSGSLY